MAILDIVVLALVQGVTEFLPISSSGHLVLWPLLTGRIDQGVTMDVAVHLGTLVAVCLYFRADTARLVTGGLDLARRRRSTPDARLARLVAIATVPAVVAGLALKLSGADTALRSVEVIGWATLLGGGALWLADCYGFEHRAEADREGATGWKTDDAVIMGLAQALALVPGTSRSGICMTAARALGFRRDEAARLALLMAIPVILAASLVETAALLTRDATAPRAEAGGTIAVPTEGTLLADLALGAGLSFVAALAALYVMMGMFKSAWTMTPFVLYRLALGTGLLALAYL
ncbi:MAG: undecaprenyl-diphosphate phosphatase [Paracoccaceae bacterium]